jgi:hypothetical protein
MQNDRHAVRFDLLKLGGDNILREDDSKVPSERLSRAGSGDAMVTRRRGDEFVAAPGEGGQFGHGATELEGACSLEVLGLEKDSRSCTGFGGIFLRSRGDERGLVDVR